MAFRTSSNGAVWSRADVRTVDHCLETPNPGSYLGLYVGFPREEWEWLKDPRVEFLNAAGAWMPVNSLSIDPRFPTGTSKYRQPGMLGFDFRFNAVTTTGIRLMGTAGGHPVDATPTYGSAVSELTVHAE